MLAYYSITLGMQAVAFITMQVGFFTQAPTYKCTFHGEDPKKPEEVCTLKNICAQNDMIESYKLDYGVDTTLTNWFTEMDLTCASKLHVSLIGAAYFIGWSTTLLWVPRLGDVYGRKLLFTAAMFVDLALLAAVFLVKSSYAMMAIMFAFGALSSVRVNIGFVYLMEFMTKDRISVVGTFFGMTEALIYLGACVYYWLIAKNWLYYTAGALIF